MDSAYDVPDATDWLPTPLSGLATVENALHCSICKDFYDTPMITSCCHTFCSKCIRTSLSADGKCPACRTADQASKLRNNWALQELVTAFLDARPAALEVARKEKEVAAESRRPGKRKRVVLSSEDEPVRTTRSKSRRIAASQESQPEIVEVEDSDEDETFEPEEEQAVDDGLVECPLGCGKRMKIEAVEPHLDKCEDERKRASRSKSRTPVNGTNPFKSFSRESYPPERLPELSYSLFNETKLGKKLKELGIPATGSKQLMIKRHKEWVNIWNANCDSNRPRSKRELLQELDSWERTQGGKAPSANGLASTIMRKDFDAGGWASSNRSDFGRLIADARRKKSNPAVEGEKEKEKDVEMVNGVDTAPEQQSEEATASDASVSEANGDMQDQPTTGNEAAFPPTSESNPVDSSQRPGQQDSGETAAPLPSSQNDSRDFAVENGDSSTFNELDRQTSRDEHALHEKTGAPCELPAHLSSSQSPVKKMPMFAVPREAVGDADGRSAFGS